MDHLDSSNPVPNLSGNGGSLWPRAAAASSSPCPGANNTKITDSKGISYNLLCGTSIVGSDTKSPVQADSLAQCLDLCTSTQGTCAGVTYSNTTCYRKNFVGPSAIKSSGAFAGSEEDNSAVAVIPGPSTDDCKSLGSCYQSSSSDSNGQKTQQQQHGFQLYCGQDYKRDDLTKVFAASMTQCLDACAAAAPQGCVAVAYQSGSRGNGVLNCYLKNGTDTQALVDGSSYDTSAAFMLSASTNNGVCPSSASSPTTSSSSVAASPTTTPMPGSAGPTPEAASSSSTSAGTIAGATVGGVAGLAVLCLLVFMLMRRRKRRAGSDGKHNEGGSAPHANYLQAPSVPPPPSSSNFSNFPEGYGVSTPTSATAYNPQQQQQQQQEQQQGYYAPPHEQFPYHQQQPPPPQEQQKQPETFVQSYYEVDGSPRAVEVEAPMNRPTEMADQSVWSNHEPKTLVMRMR
ncbi:hypothetical protein PG991_007793 [Apiospora marii]|uniref:Apple domain-containing protein n=1 Tax=Apiospora marii TaxID=335849 RepID=A0ABR1RWI4_9PEZI